MPYEDPIVSNPYPGVPILVFAGVQIPCQARKIAARNMKAHPMALLHAKGYWPKIDRDFVDFSGLRKLWVVYTIAIAQAAHAVLNVECLPGSVDVQQLDGKIRVRTVRRYIQVDGWVSDDVEVTPDRIACVGQDVGASSES